MWRPGHRPHLRCAAAALVVSCFPGLNWAAEEKRAKYRLERSGQDTTVWDVATGEVVYTTSVADTSSGSDTDADITGQEEFFQGCLWTFRQQVELCEGGSCASAEILAHDLQRRLLRFYRDRQGPSAPPLEDVAWLTLGTRAEQRREMARDCPGLVVSALLLMAEALTFTGSPAAAAYAGEAELYAAGLEQSASAQFGVMLDMFPVREAWTGYQQAKAVGTAAAAAMPTRVDVVVAGCRSPLQWLWELDLPPGTRVFVYDKCGRGAEETVKQTEGLQSMGIPVRYVALEEVGGPGLMTGECTAYLPHIIRALQEGDVADYTVFVHDDGPRHLRLSLLSLVLRAVLAGTYEVPFLHLSHERYPAFRTPCLRSVYQRVFGEELRGSLSTYCCSHFVVSRQRLEARSLDFYLRLAALVAEAPYAEVRGGECNVGRKPCYVMEFLWHRVFGEADELPLRAEQPGLPLALRYEGGRASRLPSPLQVGPYMAMFRPNRYSALLESASS